MTLMIAQPTQRVLIVAGGSLLEEGVGSLLKQELDLHVSDVVYRDDSTFLQDVADARPDTILLNAEGPLDSRRILELLANVPTLAALRVIVVRPDDNTIDIYERQRIIATRSADLLALIRLGREKAN
jgi:hypothetical protein